LNYIAIICARGGSKGLPGKNIRPLAGIPLIGWSIKTAKEVKQISRVIVSTDSEEIAKIAREYGAEVPFMRPRELAQDNSPEWLVWRHALSYLQEEKCDFDALVVLPATAPLRAVEDVNNCIKEYERDNADVVITVSDANRNPYFNMVTIDNEGNSSLVIPPSGRISRRQDAPTVFDMTTVTYVVRPNFVQEHNGMFEGRVRSVFIPVERALDIDTPLDFKIAECIVATNKGSDL
jgi:CMP-N-acetylneuraminic acid synthetase